MEASPQSSVLGPSTEMNEDANFQDRGGLKVMLLSRLFFVLFN